MMICEAGGVRPRAAASARAAENAVITGDVSLGENVSVWYGAVLRGDSGPIRVGGGSNIQDHCALHCGGGQPLTVGENVVVGHGAILHSCTIADGCLVGMGAIVLDGCVIGAGSIIGAGALVPPGKIIPPGSLVMGVPGKAVRQVTEAEQAETLENAAHYVHLGREQLQAIQTAQEEKTP